MRKGKLARRRGQSIIEYLVVVAAVIAALLFLAGQIGTPMNNLGNAATNRLGVASDAIMNYVNVSRQ